jgi:hypothetical protein
MQRFRAAIGLLLVAGGCAGNSCSCAGSVAVRGQLPSGFPAEQRHPNGVQLRVTDQAVAFLEAHAAEVIEGAAPSPGSSAHGP